MNDLIHRHDSINTVNNALMEWSCMEPWRDAKIVDSLHDIPPAQPADVVEVVRCMDCKFSHHADPNDNHDEYICDWHEQFYVKDSGLLWHSGDYCSYGKRREDE